MQATPRCGKPRTGRRPFRSPRPRSCSTITKQVATEATPKRILTTIPTTIVTSCQVRPRDTCADADGTKLESHRVVAGEGLGRDALDASGSARRAPCRLDPGH